MVNVIIFKIVSTVLYPWIALKLWLLYRCIGWLRSLVVLDGVVHSCAHAMKGKSGHRDSTRWFSSIVCLFMPRKGLGYILVRCSFVSLFLLKHLNSMSRIRTEHWSKWRTYHVCESSVCHHVQVILYSMMIVLSQKLQTACKDSFEVASKHGFQCRSIYIYTFRHDKRPFCIQNTCETHDPLHTYIYIDR